MKRLLYVISATDVGEGWKYAIPDGAEAEELRAQIRRQLAEEVPIVILPAGLTLWSIDVSGEPQKTEAPPC